MKHSLVRVLVWIALLGSIVACKSRPTAPVTYEAVVMNRWGQQLLFLQEGTILNSEGVVLGRFIGNQLITADNQPRGFVEGEEVLNLRGDRINSVPGDALQLVHKGEVLPLAGNSVADRQKVAAAYLFFF